MSTALALAVIVGAVPPAHYTAGDEVVGEPGFGQVTVYGPPDAGWRRTIVTRRAPGT